MSPWIRYRSPGTSPDFLNVRDLTVAAGRFYNAKDVTGTKKVAVLGYDLAQELFGDADPIGQTILVGTTRLTVIGVLEEKGTVGEVDYDTRAVCTHLDRAYRNSPRPHFPGSWATASA